MSLLQLEHLTLRFGGLTAVNDVSLAIERGQIFAVIGPNGAGKTSVFNAITGLYPPSAGRVLIDGREMNANANRAPAFGERARQEKFVFAKTAGRGLDGVRRGPELIGRVRIDALVRAGQIPNSGRDEIRCPHVGDEDLGALIRVSIVEPSSQHRAHVARVERKRKLALSGVVSPGVGDVGR